MHATLSCQRQQGCWAHRAAPVTFRAASYTFWPLRLRYSCVNVDVRFCAAAARPGRQAVCDSLSVCERAGDGGQAPRDAQPSPGWHAHSTSRCGVNGDDRGAPRPPRGGGGQKVGLAPAGAGAAATGGAAVVELSLVAGTLAEQPIAAR